MSTGNFRMTRRNFLKATSAAAAIPLIGCTQSSSSDDSEDPKDSGPTNLPVLVIGAGLSGLYAAYQLKKRGIPVKVVEARDRVGGRAFTLDDVPGKPEAGGPTIGSNYTRLVTLIDELVVDKGPGAAFDMDYFLHVNGQAVQGHLVTGGAWTTSPANLLVEGTIEKRKTLPGSLLGAFAAAGNPLNRDDAWADPSFKDSDVALDAFLRTKGASDEAIRLAGIAPHDLADTSALVALRDAYRRAQERANGVTTLSVKGGVSRLVEKLTAALDSAPLLNKAVTEIHSRDSEVEVVCADGSSIKGTYAIVTVPFSVLRGITITPALSGAQKEAVEQLPYLAITKYFIVPQQPFWDTDQLPVSMWTDTKAERVFVNRNEEGQVASLTCWVDGTAAQELDALSESSQITWIRDELARIRPSMAGKIDVVKVLSWGRDPYAKGGYATYKPGQLGNGIKSAMIQPWQRLHFAGEHTAVNASGMESALESAERAVGEVTARMV